MKCDDNEGWTHIQRDTGITEARYRRMVSGELLLLCKCEPRRRISNERTAVSYGPHTTSTDIEEPVIINPIHFPQAIEDNLPILYNLIDKSSNKGNSIIPKIEDIHIL